MRSLRVVCFVLALPWGAASQVESREREPIELDAVTRALCMRVLEEGATSDSFWPSMHAAEALSSVQRGDLVKGALVRRLDSDIDEKQRCGVHRELARAGDLGHVAGLIKILTGPDASAHGHAAESLYKIGEVGDGVALRRAAEQMQDAVLRIMATAALARVGSPRAMADLRRELAEGSAETRGLAAWVLMRLGSEQDVAALRRCLEEAPDELAACYVVNALAALGDPEGLRRLSDQLGSKNAEIRAQSAEVVGAAGLTSFAARLTAMLRDDEIDVRVRSAQSLLQMAQAKSPRLPEDVSNLTFIATKEHPRYTEGSVARLRNGELLFAITEFSESSGDFAPARIVAKRSKDGGASWGSMAVLQENTGKTNVMSVTLRRIGDPAAVENPLGMFYLQKGAHDHLHVYLRVSHDEGATFGRPIQATSPDAYHVLNNDRVTRLSSGRLLAPVATTRDVLQENHFTSSCFLSDDEGKTWRPGAGRVDQPLRGAMEPDVVELGDGRVMMIVRTQLGYQAVAYSADGGDHWSETTPLSVPSPEAPATLRRIPATGDLLLVWNNRFDAAAPHGGRRSPLTSAISSDDGRTWHHRQDLESRTDRSYAYASVNFVQDRVVMSYWEGETEALGTERFSARFRSLPLGWFYRTP